MNNYADICTTMTVAEQRQFDILATKLAAEKEDKAILRRRCDSLERECVVLREQMARIEENLRSSVVSELGAELGRKLSEMESRHKSEIASKDAEISALRALLANAAAKGTAPSGGTAASVGHAGDMPASVRINQLETQRRNMANTAFGQKTESGRYNHGDASQQNEDADGLDLEGRDVPDEKVVEIACGVKTRIDMKGRKKPRKFQPLFASKTVDEHVFFPENLPEDAVEVGEDVTFNVFYVKGHVAVRKFVVKKYRDSSGRYYHGEIPAKWRNCMGRTQVTETVVAQVICMHFVQGVTLGDIESWLRSKGLNYAHSTVIHWLEIAADKLKPLDKPLHDEITSSGDVHSDETTLKVCDERLPGVGESGDDVEDGTHYFKRWLFCHHSKEKNLTQFYFSGRGRRTQEALKEYFAQVTEKLRLHSDGAPIYKCYDECELIARIACAVHMRRPFYKLKQSSFDAERMVNLFDRIFKDDRLIRSLWPDDMGIQTLKRREVIGPILEDIGRMLEDLNAKIDSSKEPELHKAVVYALKEYPCLIRCLDDGSLDFSNNVCERKIRSVAKYRNNSFFVGSVDSAKRFARIMSLVSSCKGCGVDVYEYLCEVFRRIDSTSEDEMVNLLPHKWPPKLANQ